MLVLLQKMALHFQQEIPFVAYKKPGEPNVKALLQKTEKHFSTTDFSEKGFVFAPFSTQNSALLIPFSEAESMEVVFETAELDENYLPRKKAGAKEKNHHLELVKKGIEAIKAGKLQKVVLARQHSVEFPEHDPWLIFQRLLEKYPSAFVYAWFHPKSGLWMGATPENLLHIESNYLKTVSLAGTRKNMGDDEVIWLEKEKKEQSLVTDFILEKLRPKLESVNISEPRTSEAGNLWHLKTCISGKLKENGTKEIIESLHPTPAVCGLPRNDARNFILKNENFDRQFYSGFLGELNLDTKKERSPKNRNQENKAYFSVKPVTDLYVNLRCMKFYQNAAQIFAGGGITEESDPESEWEETLSKIETMAHVL